MYLVNKDGTWLKSTNPWSTVYAYGSHAISLHPNALYNSDATAARFKKQTMFH